MKKLFFILTLALMSFVMFAQVDSAFIVDNVGGADKIVETQTLKDYVLGEIPLAYLGAFYLLGNLGMLFSLLLHYQSKKRRIEKKEKFNWKFWMTDNVMRILTSEVVIFVVLRFGDNFFPKMTINLFFGFLCGLVMDRLIMFFRGYTKINWFQKAPVK